MYKSIIRLFFIGLGVFLFDVLSAKVSPQDAAKLGNELTPIGAERAGNADGTIPEWTGGYTGSLGYDQYNEVQNPYPDDKILFTITPQNVDQYKDKLTPGQYEMFKKNPGTWKMNIYPTRRTVNYPDELVEALKHNALNAELADEGMGVKNARLGPPFPIPNSGLEAIWNLIMNYYQDLEAKYIRGVTDGSGGWVATDLHFKALTPYSRSGETSETVDNVLWRNYYYYSSPPIDAGLHLLLVDHINQRNAPRKAWVYSPGVRRVRRSPSYTYDAAQFDGQVWTDIINGFNGAPDRYDFKLLGKKELYIPYNNYRLIDRSLSYSDIIQKGHLNQDLVRYELHRVWEIEMTLKPGATHISPKRYIYLNEDTFMPSIEDAYDSNGNLWKLYEFLEPFDYVNKRWTLRMGVYYDFINGRYAFEFFRNENSEPIKHNAVIPESEMTQEYLQRVGQ